MVASGYAGIRETLSSPVVMGVREQTARPVGSWSGSWFAGVFYLPESGGGADLVTACYDEGVRKLWITWVINAIRDRNHRVE